MHTFKAVSCLVCIWGLAACQTAFDINNANEQLTTNFHTLELAKINNNAPLIETATTSLKALAENAAEQAGKETSTANKISFMRIAATAAWQTGDTNVIRYSDQGLTLCANDWTVVPRDCGMLAFVKDTAAVNETTRLLNQYGGNATEEQAIDVFNRYLNSANNLLEVRPKLVQYSTSELVIEFDKALTKLLCTNINTYARGLFPGGSTYSVNCPVDNLIQAAGRAGLTNLPPDCMSTCP